ICVIGLNMAVDEFLVYIDCVRDADTSMCQGLPPYSGCMSRNNRGHLLYLINVVGGVATE
ncbi:MAG: hypothetical protein WC233_07100, partial [Sphaerochaeta sp.]